MSIATATTTAPVVYTKDIIKAKLATNRAWQVRAILVLYAFQTADEQATKSTGELNGRGFNGTDALILSSFAEQIKKRQKYGNPELLTDKQAAIAAKKLPKYWAQILSVIKEK